MAYHVVSRSRFELPSSDRCPMPLLLAKSEPASASAAYRPLLAGFAAVVLLLVSVVAVAAQQGAQLSGRVTDAVTGQPIASARVVVTSAEVRTLTAQDGTFRLTELPPGDQSVEVRALGYSPLLLEARLSAGQATRVDVELTARPVEMADVEVAVRPRSSAAEVHGFRERRERGNGYFFTREEIEQRRPSRVVDLFMRVPGVQVIRTDARGTGFTVGFKRNTGIGACPAAVYLDGRLIDLGEFGLDELRIEDIEAVEVYNGPARIPAQFNRTGVGTGSPMCGVVVFWTRSQ